MFKVSKEYYILDYEGLMKRTECKYKRYKYCLVPNTRLYRYNKINYLIHDKDVFKRTRRSNFIIAKIYVFTDLSEYVKAKITFDAYYMINVNTQEITHEVDIIYFDNLSDIKELKYTNKGKLEVNMYKLTEQMMKVVINNKHRRVNAIGIRECLE